MSDDLISIGVGYSGKEVSQDGIGLSVDLILRLWNAFVLAIEQGEFVPLLDASVPKLLPGLLHDGLPEVISGAMHMMFKVVHIFRVLQVVR